MIGRVTRIEAHLLTVGDELLTGDIIDTNTAVLAAFCRDLGIVVTRAVSVPDHPREIADALFRARDHHADLCLVSGGLGPTTDDRTAEAIAAAAGVERVLDPRAQQLMLAAFTREAERADRLGLDGDRLRQLARAADNQDQARLPAGAEAIPNQLGTAPGFHLEIGPSAIRPVNSPDGAHRMRIVSMPGVPSELRAMLRGPVAGLARAWFGELGRSARRIYRTIGRGESALAPAVERAIAALVADGDAVAPPVRLHYRAVGPEVLITIEEEKAEESTEEKAEEKAEESTEETSAREPSPDALGVFDAAMHEALGGGLYGIGSAGLPERLVRVLRERGLWLAAAEACSGGVLGAQLVAVSGASRCFRGAIVPYDDAMKVELLDVDPELIRRYGAVSAEVAGAMAAGVRRCCRADIGLAITGIAGPGGGSPQKPVGTVDLAVDAAFAQRHQRLVLPGGRRAVQRAAALLGLKLLWDVLLEFGHSRVFDLALPSGSGLE